MFETFLEKFHFKNLIVISFFEYQSLSGREVDYTNYLCNKLGESISGMFGIGNSNLDNKEIERSNFDGDAERW